MSKSRYIPVAEKAARRATQLESFRRRGPGILRADAPDTWRDTDGIERRTPLDERKLSPARFLLHRALRDFVYARDHHACVACGSSESLVLDHIISCRNGGAHHPLNLQTLCGSCNSAKSSLVDAKHEATL